MTGASRGLGAGIARSLAGAGWTVAAGYRERADDAAAVAAACGDACFALRIDVSDAGSVRGAFAEVRERAGEPLAVVNNAGIADERPFEELGDDAWMRMLDVNLLGAVRCAREAIGAMRAAGFGRIVNVSSIGGQWGGRNQVHYAAAKAALINFTRSLSNLYAADGVTANALAPGLIATDMSAAELDTEAGRAKVANIPCGRLGTTDEVGAAVAYLCSDEAAYVTGQTLNLNGGMYAG